MGTGDGGKRGGFCGYNYANTDGEGSTDNGPARGAGMRNYMGVVIRQ